MSKRKCRRFATTSKPITHPLSAPGIDGSQTWRGYEYRAGPEALITAGLALSEWLPGQPGCPNLTQFAVYVDGRAVYFLRNASGSYRAVYHYTPHERAEFDRRKEEREAPEQARYEYGVAANKLKGKLALLPNSHAEYRECFTEQDGKISFGRFLRSIEAELAIGEGGYRYSARSLETMATAFATIWNELETGRIEFDPHERQRLIDGMRQEVRDVDPQFATMLQSIVAGASGADHGQ